MGTGAHARASARPRPKPERNAWERVTDHQGRGGPARNKARGDTPAVGEEDAVAVTVADEVGVPGVRGGRDVEQGHRGTRA